VDVFYDEKQKLLDRVRVAFFRSPTIMHCLDALTHNLQQHGRMGCRVAGEGDMPHL
jgi:hypothetical protein